ncbi:Fic family protein [Corynebacterium hadale]
MEEGETEPFEPDSMLARAALLFVRLAKAQPFEDGNKRTAILAAYALLPEDTVLVGPHDAEASGEIESTFHDLLARAYIYGDEDRAAIHAVVEFMMAHQPAGK